MRRPALLVLNAILLASALATGRASGRATAQDSPAVTVAAGGLINPRGFAWDASGALVVAEAGTGGDQTAEEEVPPPTGPYRGGPTARVSRIEGGCPTTVVDRLPSAVSATGEPMGASDVVFLGNRLLALVSGGGVAHANSDQPAGLYDLTDGHATLIADLGVWLRDHPVAEPPTIDRDPDGSWSALVAAPDASAVWVVESNGEQVLRVSPDGKVTRVADLSAADQAPTALAVDAQGSLYVGNRSAAPFAVGSASVLKVDADGTTAPVWTGLTMVAGLAFGPDGALYATEFSSSRDQPPFFVPGSGRVVRQTGPDTFEEVVSGLNFPTATHVGPDGALYVSLPAVGANGGDGIVVRVDLAAGPIDVQAFDLSGPACRAAGGTATAAGATQITIVDFGFDPDAVTITAGTTVTWTNTGAVDHTTVSVAAGGTSWDSGPLHPGDTYSFTFDTVGTFTYSCGIHPTMKGTIEVVPSGP